MKQKVLHVRYNRSIPKEYCLDNTIKLLTEGYLFIPNRIRKYHSNLFQTRLLGQQVVCMSGEKAAKKFYDQSLFTREGAVPKRIQATLFGKKAIQSLDGNAHLDRKMMFMSIMTQASIDRIALLTKKQWSLNCTHFEGRSNVILFHEAAKLLFQAACKWAGVPVNEALIRQKSQDMSAMIDAFGGIGPRHLMGRLARNRSEEWAADIIIKVRSGQIITSTNSALYKLAWHKSQNGRLLEPKTAAVELINLLRPITAIATYITFGALALHMYPQYKEKLQSSDEYFLTCFVQEIRRFYPFGPFLGARVRDDFIWHGYTFKKGKLVLLDIYGTNHDPKLWSNPNVFFPDRFENRKIRPFEFIPQGGGDYDTGTRCPGEFITVELLKVSMHFLANQVTYEVPLQDLSYSFRRIPTLPRSKFILSNLRVKPMHSDQGEGE